MVIIIWTLQPRHNTSKRVYYDMNLLLWLRLEMHTYMTQMSNSGLMLPHFPNLQKYGKIPPWEVVCGRKCLWCYGVNFWSQHHTLQTFKVMVKPLFRGVVCTSYTHYHHHHSSHTHCHYHHHYHHHSLPIIINHHPSLMIITDHHQSLPIIIDHHDHCRCHHYET